MTTLKTPIFRVVVFKAKFSWAIDLFESFLPQLHAPGAKYLFPAALARHSLEYVLASHPHTG